MGRTTRYTRPDGSSVEGYLAEPAQGAKAPILGHWATDDVPVPIANVDALEKKLATAGVKYEFHRYQAKHAFANEAADAKKVAFLKDDPAAAALAWQRTKDFFGTHLK